ncbi:MAG: response regulator [Cyanophyceae cyanobacterium]
MTELKLLLIDDNADDRALALRELKQEFSELQATEVYSPENLNHALQRGDFQLAITDYQLRWTTGLEVLEVLKKRYPHCPVIMFTGTGSEEIAVKAMKAGLDDYVIKSPQHFIRLASAVRLVWEREQQRQALQEAENRYQRLFEGVPIGLYRLTPDGQILEANSMLVHLLGYANRQELSAGKAIERHLEPRYRQHWRSQMKAQGAVQGLETPLKRCDGSQIWVIHSARAIKDEQERLLYYEGAVQDITERKQSEQERAQLLSSEQEARVEAEAANRLKDEFLATLSHELRTPLNSIFGWIQLLRRQKLGAKQTAQALEIIERNAKAQIQLIDDLLDVSRIIRGRMELNLVPVDLTAIVKSALDTVRPAAQAKNIQLRTGYPERACFVAGDLDRLQQVFWNLLVNAIKFTSEGGSVTVLVKAQPNSALIQVCDTGKGIDTQLLPHIFERFRQQDSTSTRTQGGLGLGLAIVRHLVELHGGKVWADSPGIRQGATFSVQLPLNRQSHPPIAPQTRGMPALNNCRVLIVEDDEDARTLIALVLRECGADVTAVGSVTEALAAVECRSPHVIVSDIAMPSADGYDLMRRIRKRQRANSSTIPAIAVTAYGRVEDQQKTQEAGFQIHLTKPVDALQLAEAVASLTPQHNGPASADQPF